MIKYLSTALGMLGLMAIAYFPSRFISFTNKSKFSHKSYFYVMMITFVVIAILQRLCII